MKKLIAIALALMLICPFAGATGNSAPLPDIEFELGALPSYSEDGIRLDFEDQDDVDYALECLTDAMSALGYAAEETETYAKYALGAARAEAKVLEGYLLLTLAGEAEFQMDAPEKGGAALPELSMSGTARELGEANGGWGFPASFTRYDYQDARAFRKDVDNLVYALMTRMDMISDAKTYARYEALSGYSFRLDGWHVLIFPNYDEKWCLVGVESGANVQAAAREAVQSFGAFIGWQPAESGDFTALSDGTQYVYEAYYGYVESVAREYAQLLASGQYPLETQVLLLEDRSDGGLILESALAYTGPDDIGGELTAPGYGEYHLYLCSNRTANAMMILVYPQGLKFEDYGERSALYGQIAPGQANIPEPAPVESDDTCALCHGTGVCYYCQGKGYFYNYQGKQTCPSCITPGVCRMCGGDGVF